MFRLQWNGRPAMYLVGAEGDRVCRCVCHSDGLASIAGDDAAIDTLLDFHTGTSVGKTLQVWEELQCAALEADGVVIGHGMVVLEAQNRFQLRVFR